MNTIHGRFTDLYDADYSHTVQGSLEAGVIVRSGVRLTVLGGVGGPVTIEGDGGLTVQGGYDGRVVENGGVLILAGGLVLDLDNLVGDTAVAVGSAITPHRGAEQAMQLQADGSLLRLNPGANIDVDSSDIRLYEDGQFVRL